MKKSRLCHICIIAALALGIGGLSPGAGSAAEGPLVLILADVSGSMQDPMAPLGADVEGMSKVEGEKALLLSFFGLNPDLAAGAKDVSPLLGLYRWRYLAGHEELFTPFLPVGPPDPVGAATRIETDFVTEFPVFNRRTPLADMLRQLDENELSARSGKRCLVVVSDGRDSFYRLDRDKAASEADALDPEAPVKGPATETRRLKEKYGEDLTLHTIFMETDDGRGDADKGRALMARMAELGGGRDFEAADLLADTDGWDDFLAVLCPVASAEPPPAPQPEVQPAPAPKPEPQPAAPAQAGPLDSDGDGVLDDADRCPGTPKGARVNSMGCWVLEGVNFDFDKWNIRPDAVPILDHAVAVLRANPGVRIEVQGHTDAYGSDAYNERLSDRRAKSVMDYFIRKGIDPDRLEWAGFGEREPIDTNKTSEGRARNRRVELKPIP